MTEKPAKVFVSYAHQDREHLDRLEEQLVIMKRDGLIETWSDKALAGGDPWLAEIRAQLDAATVIVLLVSPPFLKSDFCYGVELRRAMERHKDGTARVVPIIVRPCYWMSAPFSVLQVLPEGAEPISRAGDVDSAWLEIHVALRRLVNPDASSPRSA